MIATAKIRVVVEVSAGSWGDDCKVEQVFDQAGREAVAALERVFEAAEESKLIINGVKTSIRARVIGAPEVIAVLARKDP